MRPTGEQPLAALSSHTRAPAYIRLALLGGICALVGLLCVLLLVPAVRVLTTYRSPVTAQHPQAAAAPALTERVVLVVLSGVSHGQLSAPDDPWRFLQLRRRAGEGAYGTAQSVQPSGDAPTWTGLLTGADPARSGVVDAREAGPIPLPTLFEYVAQTNRRSSLVAGPAAWNARVTLAMPDRLELAPSSAQVGATATTVVRTRDAALVVVLIDAGRSTALRPAERFARADAQLGLIVDQLDPRRDTLIITGDHGTLADGASGGPETAISRVPVVLWGRSIKPGEVGSVDQRTIASTIARLLGLPPLPYGAPPLLATLGLDLPTQARDLLAVLELRIAAEQVIGGTRGVAAATRLRDTARDARAATDWPATIAASNQGLAVLEAPEPPPGYLTSSWTWGAGLPLVLFGSAWLVARLRHRLLFLLPSLAGLGGYGLLWCLIFFGLAGKSVSLSAVYGDWTNNLFEAGLWSGLALVAVAVVLGIRRPKAGAAREIGWTGVLVLVVLTTFLLGYILVAGLPHGELPGLNGWAAVLLALAQMGGAGLATPLAMLVAATIAEVAGRSR